MKISSCCQPETNGDGKGCCVSEQNAIPEQGSEVAWFALTVLPASGTSPECSSSPLTACPQWCHLWGMKWSCMKKHWTIKEPKQGAYINNIGGGGGGVFYVGIHGAQFNYEHLETSKEQIYTTGTQLFAHSDFRIKIRNSFYNDTNQF